MSAARGSVTGPIDVAGATFAVVASGFAEGPSQALIRFLNERGARQVVSVTHPLVAEGRRDHLVERWDAGAPAEPVVRHRPHKPPLTYVFDPVTPLLLPATDVWVGFNCLATAQGLVRRAVRRVDKVIHWNVDFVPDRFGPGMLTNGYEWLDRRCCTSSDGRVELSAAARDGRIEAYGLATDPTPVAVIPMGSWIDESPRTSDACLDAPRLVFLGHLVERMGVTTVLDLADELRRRGRTIGIDVVGGGPLLESLRDDAARRGLDQIRFYGFVADFADVQRVLAGAAVALAPYEIDETSFSRFADPGKLKAYLGASLPILLTPVPPNVDELTRLGGAESLPANGAAFADAVVRLVDDREEWRRRHRAAAEYARRFDWNRLFDHSLPALGLCTGTPAGASA